MDNYEASKKIVGGHARIYFIITIFVAIVVALLIATYFLGCLKNKPLVYPVKTDIFVKENLTVPKNIHFESPRPPLTLEEISIFEKEIRGQLPDDYKQFLSLHNGGICDPEQGLPWAGDIHKVLSFLPLLPANEYSGIRNSLFHLRELNPVKIDGFLPIAITDSECQICIAYRGSNAGKVFFTAYKYKIADNDDMIPIDVTMVPLADSFTDFLDHLVEIPNPYCRIEELGKHGTADDLAQYLAEGNSIEAMGKHDMTILSRAIAFDNSDMIQACIEHGASLSGSIVTAVENEHVHLIEMLVKAGADINERDEWGNAPLYYVGGTALPGDEGKQNRAMQSVLIKLGAIE
ncbi:MAG: SMI1/KNR4 family protein [Pirellulales bacterium]|nr:SMI1/KNR4 family protein [Pirellulales bacterium]